MATEFIITTIETVTDTNHLYLNVEFYVAGVLTHTEDFIIGRPAENRVYTGAVGPDGEILEPETYDVSPLDIKAEIVEILRGFERLHRTDRLLTGDHTVRTSQVATGQTDPLGFIARPEVQAMVGKRVDIDTLVVAI